jgi:hypothetical protein
MYVNMCSFRINLKQKKTLNIIPYQPAVCKMKTCRWTLITGVAYNRTHKAAARSGSNLNKAFDAVSSETNAFSYAQD